jgi:hypothetical protein
MHRPASIVPLYIVSLVAFEQQPVPTSAAQAIAPAVEEARRDPGAADRLRERKA